MLKAVIALGLASSVATALTPGEHDTLRQLYVDEINAIPGILWKAGVNKRFAGKPLGHSKTLCGVKNESLALLQAKVAAGNLTVLEKIEGLEIPEAFDSETNWPQCAKTIGDIRDQSNCGCCWAFAAASAASDRMCIATNATIVVPLSAQDMCFCGSSSGCDGGFPEGAWETIKSNGLVTGGQNQGLGPFGGGFCSSFSLPHCHHHGPQGSDPYPAENTAGCPAVKTSPQCPTACDAGAKAPHDDFKKDKYIFTGTVNLVSHDPDAIAQQIMLSGPLEATFQVRKDFENYVSGIYHSTSSEALGGHAIRIVGWGVEGGVKYWKVANSWNPFWGESGYFRIVRGTDECFIEDQCVASAPDVKWVGPGL